MSTRDIVLSQMVTYVSLKSRSSASGGVCTRFFRNGLRRCWDDDIGFVKTPRKTSHRTKVAASFLELSSRTVEAYMLGRRSRRPVKRLIVKDEDLLMGDAREPV